MKTISKITILALISVIVFLIFNKKTIFVDNKQHYVYLLDSINKANKEHVRLDSIRLSNKVDSLTKRIKTINYLRKNERTKFEQTISKFNIPFDSTDYTRTNDSIKKVCCTNHTN